MFKEQKAKSVAGESNPAQYLKATHVGSWLVVLLVAMLMIFFIALFRMGSVTTSTAVTGLNKDGHVTCYIAKGTGMNYQAGQKVTYQGNEVGVVTGTGREILTGQQISSTLNNPDYAKQLNITEDNNVELFIDLDSTVPQGICELDVVLSEKSPAELLFG